MALAVHLISHVFISLIIGFLIWKKTGIRSASFLGVFLGGVLIDLDHFFDYFLAFGQHFNLFYFLHGYEFLKSDRLYILSHAYEYVVILLIISLVVNRKKTKVFIFALALGLLSHLMIDIYVNNVKPQSYSILYRAKYNFDLQKLISPEKLPFHNKLKREIVL